VLKVLCIFHTSDILLKYTFPEYKRKSYIVCLRIHVIIRTVCSNRCNISNNNNTFAVIIAHNLLISQLQTEKETITSDSIIQNN